MPGLVPRCHFTSAEKWGMNPLPPHRHTHHAQRPDTQPPRVQHKRPHKGDTTAAQRLHRGGPQAAQRWRKGSTEVTQRRHKSRHLSLGIKTAKDAYTSTERTNHPKDRGVWKLAMGNDTRTHTVQSHPPRIYACPPAGGGMTLQGHTGPTLPRRCSRETAGTGPPFRFRLRGRSCDRSNPDGTPRANGPMKDRSCDQSNHLDNQSAPPEDLYPAEEGAGAPTWRRSLPCGTFLPPGLPPGRRPETLAGKTGIQNFPN